MTDKPQINLPAEFNSLKVAIFLATAINAAGDPLPNWKNRNYLELRTDINTNKINIDKLKNELANIDLQEGVSRNFDTANVTITNASVNFCTNLISDYKSDLSQGYLDDAVLLLLERVESQLSGNKFDSIELLFDKILENNLGVESLLAVLLATQNAKEFLPSRNDFLESVRKYLISIRSENEVVSLLNGLH